ncbi:T9SS type A sorting domain-containing protein [bacterium]|nr:T9SS type A sorting domain-containing protein [bacterium]
MKKLCAVCMMLAVVISVAFAGKSDVKETPVLKQAEVVDLEKALMLYEEGLDMTEAEKAAVIDYLGLDREAGGDGAIDAVGGPDAYGYTWLDNQAPDTATFAWQEISGTGTLLAAASNADGGTNPVAFSFNFPFYGSGYTGANVTTDGLIQFTVAATAFSNTCALPSAARGPAVMAFWEDLDSRRGGTGAFGTVSDSGGVYFQDFGTHVIVQWDSVGRFSPSFMHVYTFQAILYPDGKIKLQYLDLNRYGTSTTEPSPTVAIQGVGAGNALTYYCSTTANIAGNLTGRAVWFLPPLVAPSGRCCYLDGGVGACAELTGDECALLGGQWGGANTTCTANPCPTGRCCYVANGADQCATNIQLECNALGGVWTAGQNCVDNPCPTGRCCYNNGNDCAQVTQLLCTTLGGTWSATATCAANPCPLTVPGGSDCASAVAVGIGANYAGTTTGGVDNDPGFQCALGSTDPYEGSNTAPDKWYSIVGDGTTITVSLCNPGTSYDTQIAVFCGECSALNCVAGNDDATCSFSGLRSTARFCSNAGSVYYVVVDGWGSGNGNYELSIVSDGVPCTGAINCSPLGRCCYTDPTGAPACADVTAAECELLGGDFDASTTCADGGPCGGSCCYVLQGEGFCGDEAVCIDNALESECAALGGTWTAGGNCVDNTCPDPNPCTCYCSTFPNSHGILALDNTTYPIADVTVNSFTINVPIEYQITDLNVSIDAVHTFDGDVEIRLMSPLGTEIILSDNRGGGGDNWTCTEFDDEAANAVASGSAPFTGSWIPDNALSAFDGQNAVGNWTITFDDQVGGDFGYVIGVCLKFEYDEILPVAFGSFDAVAGNGLVTLNWNTLSESNVASFEVLRDGGKVADVTAENSATGATYSYVDNGLTNGVTYDYTLVSVDVNGDRATLATLSATPSASAVITEYALHQNYPNPFNPTTNIAFDMVEAGKVSISVFNVMGQKVAEIVNGNMEAGRHVVSFDATGLSSGLYLYKMEANGFTAQSKMVLMK